MALTRNTTVIHDFQWLQQRHHRPGLKPVVVVESRREINRKAEPKTRFYLTSLVMVAALENILHWVMDMIFRDNECRLRTDHAPASAKPLVVSLHSCDCCQRMQATPRIAPCQMTS